MPESDIKPKILNSFCRLLPQMDARWGRAFQSMCEKNASMGRAGGIALYFPTRAAEEEIDLRATRFVELIRAHLTSGALKRSPTLPRDVSDMRVTASMAALRQISNDLHKLERENGINVSLSESQIQNRWLHATEQAVAEAEAVTLGDGRDPSSINFSGPISHSVIQTGANAVANISGSFNASADLGALASLLAELRIALVDAEPFSGQDAVVAVVRHSQERAKSGQITSEGLSSALTFVLTTADTLKSLGAVRALRLWCESNGWLWPFGDP